MNSSEMYIVERFSKIYFSFSTISEFCDNLLNFGMYSYENNMLVICKGKHHFCQVMQFHKETLKNRIMSLIENNSMSIYIVKKYYNKKLPYLNFLITHGHHLMLPQKRRLIYIYIYMYIYFTYLSLHS